VIGTLEEHPTEELAQAAINGLRTCINEDRNRQPQQSVFVSDLIDHWGRNCQNKPIGIHIPRELSIVYF
jgi:hypothetical protein